MDNVSPDQIAERLMEMVRIEDRVILDFLLNLDEADQLALDVLFGRLNSNSTLLGNLALMIRNQAVKVAIEIAKTDILLAKAKEEE